MTGHIEKTIARMPEMTLGELRDWREKAQNVLAKQPENPEARRLLDAIEDHFAHSTAAERLIWTGSIGWEPHEASGCRGFVNGEQVARIIKRATHTATRKEVYSVEIMGEVLASRFHHISDARDAGWVAFQKKGGK
jgi:hypothetical protein